jgi:2'-5' RNA ligase
MHYNFFIHLPAELNKQVVAYNHELHKQFSATSRFAFAGLLQPHISLFFGLFQDGVEQEMLKKVAEIKFTEFELVFERLEVDLPEGYIQMYISQPDELLSLHWQVIEAVNPFRGNLMRTGFSKDPAQYSRTELEMFELYGSRHFGKLYNPHLSIASLGSIKSEKAEQIIDPNLEGKKFTVKGFDIIRSTENNISDDPAAILVETIKAL